jgi:hypothetical protein
MGTAGPSGNDWMSFVLVSPATKAEKTHFLVAINQ